MFKTNSANRRIEMFIFDIYIAILKIKKVSSKFDNAQELLYDFTQWDSVIREFEIIGEATKYLLKDNLISNKYRKIVDFRNQITHEYFGIDPDIVWSIIQIKLDEIETIILQLINNIEKGLKLELIESYIEDNKYIDFIVKDLLSLKTS